MWIRSTVALLLAILFLPIHAKATPLVLEYDVTEISPGLFDYEFQLVLDNNDGAWTPGQDAGWVIFGDAESSASPISDFACDPTDFPVGPWTFCTQSGGFHNGPTLGPVVDVWVPSFVGDFVSWSGTSANLIPEGQLLWSALLGSLRVEFQTAVLGLSDLRSNDIPAPTPLAVLGLGLLGLGVARRRKAA